MRESINENKFRILLESLYDLIFLYRIQPDKRFEYVSPSSINLNGYTPQEHYENPQLFDDLVIDEDKPLFQFIKENPGMIDKPVILRWKHKDGRIIWTEHRFVNYHDENNNIISLGGFVRDVSDRKDFEFALRESEKKFRELFHQINDGIMLFKTDKSLKTIALLEVNNSTCDMLGYSREEIFGLEYIGEIILMKDFEELSGRIEELKKYGHTHFETILISKKKEKVSAEISASIFRLDKEIVILTIIRDITERKKLEKELLKKHRLESISILAARIAHDFNKILSAILGNI